jgi:Flp pilus assembly pilin Flp
MHRFSPEFTMRLTFLPSKVTNHRASEERAAFRLLHDTQGTTAIEYTLIAALIAMAFVILIQQIGDFVSIPFETVAAKL